MTRAEPWRGSDLVVLLGGDAAALAVILAAWYGASGELTPSRQVAWVAAGAGAIILAGAVNAVWLVRARRSIGTRRAGAVLAPTELLVAGWRQAPVAELVVVSVPRGDRYHRPSCPLVAGKDATVTAASDIGRAACGVCAP